MKNKNGFTLIEMLAIIIILAAIAAIATPLIVEYVDNAEIASKRESAAGYIKAVDQAIGIVVIDEIERIVEGTYNIQSNGDLVNASNPNDRLDVIFKGETPTGTIKVAEEKTAYALLKFDNTTVKFENNKYVIQ